VNAIKCNGAHATDARQQRRIYASRGRFLARAAPARVGLLQGRLDRLAKLCDVSPRDTESFREFEDLMGGALADGCDVASGVLATLEHVKALEQPIREACKRVERGIEAVEAEARCLSFAWLCWQALAMRAGGADMAMYMPISATVLRLHLRRTARGIHVKGDKADALGSAAGIRETERRGRCVVYAEADFLHILQRLFLSQDGELYSLRFGVACSVEPGAGGEPAVWWAPRAKRKRAAAL
jgi:hypothetical protein